MTHFSRTAPPTHTALITGWTYDVFLITLRK